VMAISRQIIGGPRLVNAALTSEPDGNGQMLAL
jgi:hypothetical protein